MRTIQRLAKITEVTYFQLSTCSLLFLSVLCVLFSLVHFPKYIKQMLKICHCNVNGNCSHSVHIIYIFLYTLCTHLDLQFNDNYRRRFKCRNCLCSFKVGFQCLELPNVNNNDKASAQERWAFTHIGSCGGKFGGWQF